MYPYTDGELDTLDLLQTLIQVSYGMEDTQARAYCSVGIIFVCHGIAEIHQQSIAQQLGNIPVIALDHVRTCLLIRLNHLSQVLRIELGGEFGRIDQITEHHGELATFGCWRTRFGWWSFN